MKTHIAPLLVSALCAAAPAQTSLILLGPVDTWLTLPDASASAEATALRSEYLASLASLEASLPSPFVVATGTYAAPPSRVPGNPEPAAFLEAAGVDAVVPSPVDLDRGPWHLNGMARVLEPPLVTTDLDMRGLSESETRYTTGMAPILQGGQPVAALLTANDPGILEPVLDLQGEMRVDPALLSAWQASAEPLPSVVLSLGSSEATEAITIQVPVLEPHQAAVYALTDFSRGGVPEPRLVDLLASAAPPLPGATVQITFGPRLVSSQLDQDVKTRIPFDEYGEYQHQPSEFSSLPVGHQGPVHVYQLFSAGQPTSFLLAVDLMMPSGGATRLYVALQTETSEARVIWTPVRTTEGRVTDLPERVDALAAIYGLSLPPLPSNLRGVGTEYEAIRRALGLVEANRSAILQLP